MRRLSGAAGVLYQDVHGLEPGQFYHISAVTEPPGGTGEGFLLVHDGTGAAAVQDGPRTFSALCQTFSANFQANSREQVRIHVGYTGGTGEVRWRDVQFIPGWLFGFYYGSLGSWVPFGSSVPSAVTGLELSGGPGGVYRDVSGLTPGEYYNIRVIVRTNQAGGEPLLYVHDTTGDHAAVSEGGYVEGEIAVNFQATMTGRVRIHLMHRAVPARSISGLSTCFVVR